jgi:hypothetical protein
MSETVFFQEARKVFHAALLKSVLKTDSKGVCTNADKDSKISVSIARGIAARIGAKTQGARLAGQEAGNRFEQICADFVEHTFLRLAHLRPGIWSVDRVASRNRLEIARFDQYSHLVALDAAARENPELAAALGSDYTITPDIIISREPESDEAINRQGGLVDSSVARKTSLRRVNSSRPILHASISCKWTIRSDRAQNARSEALNLVRNRKGHLPHIAVITGEPTPNRISSIALGTGDIDCVYHFALPELTETIGELDLEDSVGLLKTMVDGKRLRDISDLPLDLAV